MKLVITLAFLSTVVFAADYPRVIFSDDFSSEGFGPRWGHYKSSSVVKGGVSPASPHPRLTTPQWTTFALRVSAILKCR